MEYMRMGRWKEFFSDKIDYAVLFLRVVIGIRLLVASWAAAFSWQGMLEVKDFFESVHLPIPLVSAIVAVYAELLGGVLFMVGFKIRFAALLMVINFVVAIAFVDIRNVYTKAFPAWVILTASFFFLCYGAGKISLDRLLSRQEEK